MLHVVPVEPLEQRYTAQWLKWSTEELMAAGVSFRHILPHSTYTEIKSGQFLDVIGTNEYKAQQLQQLCLDIREGRICAGDTIMFHDLWFPGIEMLFYIRDALSLKLNICGIIHAGTYDPHDYLTQRGMTRWAKRMERAWLNEVDLIFVSTQRHAELLLQTRIRSSRDIAVTGLPMMSRDFPEPPLSVSAKENLVVFPHRITPEKQPHLFEELRRDFGGEGLFDWLFVCSKDVPENKSKMEYYKWLGRGKVAVSFALQETWGIGMQEAAYMGCVPLVPDRLVYPDIYPPDLLYNGYADLCHKLQWVMDEYDLIVTAPRYVHWLQTLQEYNNGAIKRMVEVMRERGWL